MNVDVCVDELVHRIVVLQVVCRVRSEVVTSFDTHVRLLRVSIALDEDSDAAAFSSNEETTLIGTATFASSGSTTAITRAACERCH